MRTIKRPIIGIAGRATSGKSLAALTLKSSGWKVRAFADPIKEALAAVGLTHEQLYGSEKELPSDILGGNTPRFAMQSLGDWGRDNFGKGFYVRILRSRIMQLPVDTRIAVEDVRYQNEADMIRAFGGTVVMIRRSGADASPVEHSSEALDFTYDFVLDNDGTAKEFMDAVEEVGERLLFDMSEAAE